MTDVDTHGGMGGERGQGGAGGAAGNAAGEDGLHAAPAAGNERSPNGESAAPRKPGETMVERLLAEKLTEGPHVEPHDRERLVQARISPKYEVRIQAELDPIVEETRLYRSMAQELDGRYDRYAKDGGQRGDV